MNNLRKLFTGIVIMLALGCERFGLPDREDSLSEPVPLDLKNAKIDPAIDDSIIKAILEVVSRVLLSEASTYKVTKVEVAWPDSVVAAKVTVEGITLIMALDRNSKWQVIRMRGEKQANMKNGK